MSQQNSLCFLSGKIKNQIPCFPCAVATLRLHSSRMRTARALTVSPSMLCGEGGLLPGGVSASRGSCLLLGGGVCSRGCLPSGEGCLLRGVCSWGGLLRGGVASQHALRQTPPCGQTDTCKNITFANYVCWR